MFRAQKCLFLLTAFQIYFAFAFHNFMLSDNRNGSIGRIPTDNISSAEDDGCSRYHYSKANILTAFHPTLPRKENPSKIPGSHISLVLNSSLKSHDPQLKYYLAPSLGNGVLCKNLNTSAIKLMVCAHESHSDKMASREKQCTVKNLQKTRFNHDSAKEHVYSILFRFKSCLSSYFVYFGLFFMVFGYRYSCRKISANYFAFFVLLGLFDIFLSIEIALLCSAVIFGVFLHVKTFVNRPFLPFLNYLFHIVHSIINGKIFRGKITILSFCIFVGLINLAILQLILKLSIEFVLLACLHNIVVLTAYCLVFNKRSDFRNSSENNSEETRLNFPNYNRIESLEILKNWQTSEIALRKQNQCISIVGISCRFAGGVNSKDAYWDLLVRGGCVIGSYPENRLEALTFTRFYNPARQISGKHYTLNGAFLDEISGFDAQFFGISPAECRAMDPQQRLLLQGVYEAIEDAGLKLEDLQACRTGVYVGLMNLDYGRLLLDDKNVPNIDEFASTGITASTAANRISFSLNLNGPSLTVDTACSSSLSALNIAVTHLKARECDVAIVCAPNLILARYFHTACCRTGLLAEDGRCKSFDAKGDGYGRGEGVAVVILKPAHDALQDHDAPYANILACGLNNDGQTAIPMTAPSDRMQAELARRVLIESGLRKTDVQYVETHGTGTAVGDVVEMRSVSEVYANNSSRLLRIGSVKSNINHTESTAGLAGLIKVCLMTENGYFVPTVNIQELKSQLKIAERKMIVQTKLEPWTAVDGKPKTAAVCSYGYGGANAHVIIQEVQSTESMKNCQRKRDLWILTLSARSREALRKMAGRFSDWFEKKPDNESFLKENICYTLNNRRSVHSHKLALTFSSLKQAANVLKLFSKDSLGWQKYIAMNDNSATVKKLAFVYGGQGHSWYSMVSELIHNEEKFKESIQQIDGILEELQIPWRLMETLGKIEAECLSIQDNSIAQMSLFGVHYALTQLLKSWGIIPSAVVGHSLGEISAACAAHVISLETAVQLILLRAGLQENCSPTGRMMAVGMSPEAVGEMITVLGLVASVSVAAVNSLLNVVLSGDQKSMQVIEDYLKKNHREVFHKRLGTTRAFHSHEMDLIKKKFLVGMDRLELIPGRARVPFYSTVTGTQISQVSPGHWWDNVREPVLFSPAVRSMMSDGYKVFVEINAAPQFPRYMQEISSQMQSVQSTEQSTVILVETLPKRSEKDRYLSFLRNCPATLYTQGFPIAWDKVQGSGTKTFIRCPSYPWQERKYWYREREPVEHVGPLANKSDLPADVNAPDKLNIGSSTLNSGLCHPLLGKAVATIAYSGLHAWKSEIDVYSLPYLKDHRFQSSEDVVIPGAVYVEMGLALVLHMFPNVLPRLQDVTFENLLTLSTNEIARFCTRLDTTGRPSARHGYQITTVQENGNEVLVSKGFVSFDEAVHHCQKVEASNTAKISSIRSRLCKQPLEVLNSERVRRRFAYGPQFSLIIETWCSETEALCSIVVPEEIRSSQALYVVHPAIIDACFQSLFLLENSVEKSVPYGAADVRIHHRNFTRVMYCHLTRHVDDGVDNHVSNPNSSQENICDIALMDCHGSEVLLIKKFKMVDLSNVRPSSTLGDVSYQIRWQPGKADTGVAFESKVWLIIPDHCGFSEKFTRILPKDDPSFVFEFPEASSSIGNTFLEVLEKAIETLKPAGYNKVCIVSFLPVDNSILLPDWKNFRQAHYQAFESSLLLLQTILTSKHVEDIQFVLVTCEAVPLVANHANNPAFPWSSTLLGFRRTVAEELSSPKIAVIDLPENPSGADFQLMLNDLQRGDIGEEIAYRKGSRYHNQIKRLGSLRLKNVQLQNDVKFSNSGEFQENNSIFNEAENAKMNGHGQNCKNVTIKTRTVDTLASSFKCENGPGELLFPTVPFDPKRLKEDKSYLVVGGVRGFGFELVRWLLQNGAKTVICTARSAANKSKMTEVARLEQETGARILLRQADVTSWQDMLAIVRELDGLPRLAGIVFTAMVLEDQRIKDADLETCARVVATKVQGSVILHQLSLRFDLDFFIMFSSIAGIVGNVGQIAYSGANTFLDSLCDYRRNKLGLPALSVAWGTMGGAGILERSKDIASLFQSYGFRMMSCKKGLKFLEEFLVKHSDQSQIIICDIDWSIYLKSSAYILHRSPRLQSLYDETRISSTSNDVTSGMTLEQLACLDPAKRRRTVEEFIRRLLSTWTEGDCHEVDLNLALYKYGVDSIGAANMSLKIRNGVGAIFEIYYFIQPKTTGMTIINDTLEQIRNFQRDKLNTTRAERESKLTQTLDGESETPRDIPEDEMKSEDYDVKVIPLYVPDDALVKVFIIHSSHKSALANAPFAAGFKHQETVALYSIGTEDLKFESRSYGSVRSLAKKYINLIKTVQRTGPYYLAGFSFGGILSYEMACQLTQDDEEVAMVTMLDTMTWFPKSFQDNKTQLEKFQDFLVSDLKKKMVGRYLRSIALGRLGFSSAEFERLMGDLGRGEKLCLALEERAKKMNVSIGDVKGHVTCLEDQSERACHAHLQWTPPEIKYEQTITYVRCENANQVKQSFVSWDPVELWGSLTNQIDVITLPSSHLELLDQPYAEICGLVIMTTAVTKRRSHTEWQLHPRSNQKERLVNFLKSAVEVLIFRGDDLFSAKLWLNEEKNQFVVHDLNKKRRKNIEINLNDIHNIIPGKYAIIDRQNKMKCLNKNLVISLAISGNQKFHIISKNQRQRDHILDAFEVLIGIPLLRFHY